MQDCRLAESLLLFSPGKLSNVPLNKVLYYACSLSDEPPEVLRFDVLKGKQWTAALHTQCSGYNRSFVLVTGSIYRGFDDLKFKFRSEQYASVRDTLASKMHVMYQTP